MADSTQPPGDPSSYTKMDSSDMEAIGTHCRFAYCNQYDFLPFHCESCKSSFCLDHRSETAHSCPRAGEWAKNRRRNSLGTGKVNSGTAAHTLNGLNPTQCSQSQCKTVINTVQNTGSRCNNCNRQYCLKHRFQEEHECEKIAALGPRQSSTTTTTSKQLEAQAEKLRLGFSRLRSWGKGKQESLRPSTATATATNPTTTLNSLKRSAKGDPALPPDKRIYLHLEAEARSTSSRLAEADVYFSRDWTVGRVLDEAAKRLQIANVNNRVEAETERLRIYHVRGGRLLAFGDRIGADGVLSGDTLVLLRGVGPVS